MKFKLILLCCFLFVLVTGCAKPPLAEMDSAREAVFRAENDSNAVLYGSGSLLRAQDALRRMQAEADAKRYDAARTHASEAIAAAERAVAEGRTGASRQREEVASLLSSLKIELDETNKNLSGARYSGLALDYDILERDLRNAYIRADIAEADFAGGKYQESIDRARSVRSDLGEINRRISNAVTRRK
uniref:DUF4398 domain-containing protein n=1 Tax=uncultured bacterium contig00053 TaxID=1181537 RepID=A0A806KJX9_9BACT|nr:hypothetical protein [uncultured bacterium contig00053]